MSLFKVLSKSSIAAALASLATDLHPVSVASATTSGQAVNLGQLDGGRSVLDFSGVDNEAKLVTALASGTAHLFIPAGTVITVTSAKTVPASTLLRGGGPGAGITASGSNINALVIGGDDVTIEGLTIVACGTGNGDGSNTNGAGIFANGRSRLKLRRLKISNHYTYGISLNSCVDCDVEDNYFSGSTNVASDQYTQSSDIALLNGCQYNRVRRNRCYSGASTGVTVQVQDSLGVYSAPGNVISENHIANCMAYGILLYQRSPSFWVTGTTYTAGTALANYIVNIAVGRKYRCTTAGGGTSTNAPTHSTGTVTGADGYAWLYIGSTTDVIYDTLIANNTVWNILGSQTDSQNILFYGAGIYCVFVDSTKIIGNKVRDVCLNTTTETLAPAGIGCGCADVQIIGNEIINSRWIGIMVHDSQKTGRGSPTLVSNNKVRGSTKVGYKYKALDNCISTGNVAETNANGGFNVEGVSAIITRVYQTGDVSRSNTVNSGFSASGSAVTEWALHACVSNADAAGITCATTVARTSITGCRAESASGRSWDLRTLVTLNAFDSNSSVAGGTADQLTCTFPAGARLVGTGSPEAAITANIGAEFIRSDGGTTTTHYYKESGTGTNTGWIAK